MKKLFLLSILATLVSGVFAQNLCLQTQCVATKVRVGDTAAIGAVLNASAGYGSITYTQISGPTAAVMTLPAAAYTTSIIAQQNAYVSNLDVGSYVFKVTGSDKIGGIVTGIDSIVVSPAAVACPVIPPASNRIVSWTVVQVGGIGRVQVTYWDQTIALLP